MIANLGGISTPSSTAKILPPCNQHCTGRELGENNPSGEPLLYGIEDALTSARIRNAVFEGEKIRGQDRHLSQIKDLDAE